MPRVPASTPVSTRDLSGLPRSDRVLPGWQGWCDGLRTPATSALYLPIKGTDTKILPFPIIGIILVGI